MIGLEYGKPFERYLPQCQKCQGMTFALCPIPMSEFVLEHWKLRMDRVLKELVLYCHKCGQPVKVGDLKFTRL